VLPDTTYLERHDVLSMLDRPISEFDGPVDAVRLPVLPPKGECRPFQDVLIELGGRLKLPAFVKQDGTPKYRNYPDRVLVVAGSPGSGIGFLAGWRGNFGEKYLKGEPNPRQWEQYAANGCVFHHELPRSYQYMRNWNKGYLHWAAADYRRHGDALWQRFNAGPDDILWYYRELSAIFNAQGPEHLAAELALVVAELHATTTR